MINGNITEFLDKLYYGDELLFEYQGVTYFLQGWIKNDQATMVLDIQDSSPFKGYLWECVRKTMKECADEFLDAHLWNKKTFLEIEKTITWID